LILFLLSNDRIICKRKHEHLCIHLKLHDPPLTPEAFIRLRSSLTSRRVISALEKSFDIIMTLFSALPPAALAFPGCDCAVVPVRNCRKIFSSGNTGASQCAMSPQWGRAGAREAIIT
jgi:hypothetical protein